jgi:hypothetical protein
VGGVQGASEADIGAAFGESKIREEPLVVVVEVVVVVVVSVDGIVVSSVITSSTGSAFAVWVNLSTTSHVKKPIAQQLITEIAIIVLFVINPSFSLFFFMFILHTFLSLNE